MLSGREPTEALIKEIKSEKIKVIMTLNEVEWYDVGEFFYYGITLLNYGLTCFKMHKWIK